MPSADESISLHRALFADAVRRRDAEMASSVYALDAHLLAPSARAVVGRAEIRDFWQAGFDAGVADVLFVADDLNHNDGLAYETGSYEFRLEPSDGGRVMDRGHYVHVHQRQADGSWQRAVEIFSPGGEK